jgi:hypothetical protein
MQQSIKKSAAVQSAHTHTRDNRKRRSIEEEEEKKEDDDEVHHCFLLPSSIYVIKTMI